MLYYHIYYILQYHSTIINLDWILLIPLTFHKTSKTVRANTKRKKKAKLKLTKRN